MKDMKKMDQTEMNAQPETAMGDSENFDVIKEKIKNKPLNRKKLLRRTLITAAMALLFGIIACVSFLILEPVFSNLIYPKEETVAEEIIFPEVVEDILPEDLLQEEEPAPDPLEGITALTDEQLDAIINSMTIEIEDYKSLYAKLSQYARKLATAVVCVTGVSTDENWFDESHFNTGQTAGIIVAMTTEQYLVLVDVDSLENAASYQVTFYDDSKSSSQLIQTDQNTGYGILAVDVANINATTLATITVATLGSSNSSSFMGSPIIAYGKQSGHTDFIDYGVITSEGDNLNMVDKNYRIFTTDILTGTSPSGILFNLSGQVIGLIDNSYNSSDMKNILSFIGISELRSIIESMSNNSERGYFGVYGTDVTSEISEEYGVPRGAYVTEIVMDSPAMNSGIQSGDVIVKFNGTTIMSFTDLSNLLLVTKSGTTADVTVMRLKQGEYQEMHLDVNIESAIEE